MMLISMGLSVVYGYTETSWRTVWEAYTQFNGSNEHLVIRSVRLPRALIGAAVGASLGMAGAIMQAMTKNPLASPGIFGVNAGAGFLVVCAVSFFSISNLTYFSWIAFCGAAAASLIVYLLGSLGRDGLTPMKLTLAGSAMAALFTSMTQGLLVMNEKALEEVLFWLAGSVSGRKLEHLLAVFPYLLFAWIGSIMLARDLNVLMMGDDMATGLGQKTVRTKMLAAVMIVLLAGGSVSVAGPIGFVGIVVPHMARFLIGADHRWVIPYSGLIGGILLVLADVGARYVIMPGEVPVGVVTAAIGLPFFIYIVRKGLNRK
jgi:iron complex transport system permease protein